MDTQNFIQEFKKQDNVETTDSGLMYRLIEKGEGTINPKATQTDMRALAYPAEDPSGLKKPEDLMNYYIWMLSSESSSHDGNYIEYR